VRPSVLLTTVNAAVQRVPAKNLLALQALSIAPGNMLAMDGIVRWLELNGFMRASTVREAGEYAVRGGIIDLFPPGLHDPVRLDFFGDTLESIRAFDPETQRTTCQLRALDLVPMSEVRLTSDSMRRFRQAYVAHFGAQTRGDALYEAVSEGRRHQGLEHWLPLFYEKLDTLFDYCAGAPLIFDPLAEAAASERFAQIEDYYGARKAAHDADPGHSTYKPLPPSALYLAEPEWRERIRAASVVFVSPFAEPETGKGLVVDCGSKPGRTFAAERADPNANVFSAAIGHARALQAGGKWVVLAAWSDGSRERLAHVLAGHGFASTAPVSSLAQALALLPATLALAVIGIEQGFEAADLALIGEQDILGDRLLGGRRKPRRAQDFLTEAGALTAGMSDGDEGVRIASVQSAGKVNSFADAVGVAKTTGDSSPAVRMKGAELLGTMHAKDAVGSLINLATNDANPDVRAAAAHSLGMLHDATARPALEGLQNDPNQFVKDAARIALRRL
jgi:transcription-repair coupling factor (superfamily II helicase)